MNIFQVFILSLVEGLTEFLPVSSTGHLILVSHLLGIVESEFLKSFEIIIQLGAILAVVFLYFRVLIKNLTMWKYILAAFIPTGLAGLVLYKFVKTYLLGNTEVVVWSLLLGGVVIILFEKYFKTKAGTTVEKTSLVKIFGVGILQSISMIPGVSRAAATIFGGMGMGLSRKNAVEFSFFLAIPTMFAATALDLVKTRLLFSPEEYLQIALGFGISFVIATLSVKYLLKYIEKHDFTLFGVYRIILAFLFLVIRP